MSLSQVPGALKLYYLVLAIILTSPTPPSTSTLQSALTLLVDLGLGGSSYNVSTKKKANTNTKPTATNNTNIIIAIENLNKLTMSLTQSLGSKVSNTNNANPKDIRVNVCACHYDNTDDVFYSTRLDLFPLSSISTSLSLFPLVYLPGLYFLVV